MAILDPTVALSTRQEAFCRHFTVSGNADRTDDPDRQDDDWFDSMEFAPGHDIA